MSNKRFLPPILLLPLGLFVLIWFKYSYHPQLSKPEYSSPTPTTSITTTPVTWPNNISTQKTDVTIFGDNRYPDYLITVTYPKSWSMESGAEGCGPIFGPASDKLKSGLSSIYPQVSVCPYPDFQYKGATEMRRLYSVVEPIEEGTINGQRYVAARLKSTDQSKNLYIMDIEFPAQWRRTGVISISAGLDMEYIRQAKIPVLYSQSEFIELTRAVAKSIEFHISK